MSEYNAKKINFATQNRVRNAKVTEMSKRKENNMERINVNAEKRMQTHNAYNKIYM